jgi:hypothetical protein
MGSNSRRIISDARELSESRGERVCEAEYIDEYPIFSRLSVLFVCLFPVESILWVEFVAGLTFDGTTLRLFDLSVCRWFRWGGWSSLRILGVCRTYHQSYMRLQVCCSLHDYQRGLFFFFLPCRRTYFLTSTTTTTTTTMTLVISSLRKTY